MTTPPHFPDRQIPQPPATIQPTVGYASIIAPMPSGWTAVTDRRIQTLEADIDRLTRERDAARAECRAWRMNDDEKRKVYEEAGAPCSDFPDWHPVFKAMTAHDLACPGWEEAK